MPQVRKEIGAFAWHSIAELPADKEEGGQVYVTDSGERHRFFVVWPFVKTLRKWIKKQRQGRGKVGKGQPLQDGGPVQVKTPARCETCVENEHCPPTTQHTVLRRAAMETVALPEMPAAWRDWKLDHAAVLRELAC